MKVALLTPAFWPEVRRGTERVVHEVAGGLRVVGHEPLVITSHPGRPGWETVEGVEVLRVPRPPDGRLERRAFEWYLTHVPFTYAALRATRPDVAHAWFTTDALAAVRWGARTGRPVVHTYMGIPDHPGLMDRRRRLEITLRVLDGADVTTALSHHAAREFERWLGRQVRVIPPPVDVGRFAPGPGRAEVPTIVCAADAREPRKRVALLLGAFARVRRELPQARLWLDARTAAGMADPSGGVEAVAMTDLPSVYRQAWLSVLPSFGEAFGLVLAEAMACGTPGVGTDAGGITEVVREGTGVLFSGGEAELSRALLHGLELAGDRTTARRCRERALELSTERVSAEYADLYRSLR